MGHAVLQTQEHLALENAQTDNLLEYEDGCTHAISALTMAKHMKLQVTWLTTTLGWSLIVHTCLQSMIAISMWSVLSPLAVCGMYDKCKIPSLSDLLCQLYSYAFKYMQKGCDMATFELQQHMIGH